MTFYQPATSASGRVYRPLPRLYATKRISAPILPKTAKTIAVALDFTTLADAVAEAFGLHRDDLICRDRPVVACRPRHALMSLAHDLLGAGPSKIAHWMGRDHSTVRHGLGAHAGRMRTDAAYAAKVERALSLFEANH